MSLKDPPEFQVIPELVARLIELFDVEKIQDIEINDLLSTLLNFILEIRKAKIEEFTISKAEMPIPGYAPGVFPKRFVKVNSLKEIVGYTPQILWAEFIITLEGESRIKARGIGELTIYKKDGEMKVESRDIWFIEEVKEIEPDENREPRANKLSGFVKEVVVALLARLLGELANRVVAGK